MPPEFTLTLSCANRPGIVAAVSRFIFEHGGDIREAHQFDDPETRRFFARMRFTVAEGDGAEALTRLRDGFRPRSSRSGRGRRS